MKKKANRKRGFTLVEMVITIAVTIVLMSTITSLIVAVVDERRRSAVDYEVSNNLYLAKNAVYDWYDNFAGETFTALLTSSGEIGGVTITTAAGDFAFSFNKTEKTLTTPKYNRLFLSSLEDISFSIYNADGTPFDGTTPGGAGSVENPIIKIQIAYRGGSKPVTMLLTGRVYQNA